MWDNISTYWDKISTYIEKYHMINTGDTVILGISGGADSVFLARFFLWFLEKKEFTLLAVHINHLLRGEEAERDEEFVQRFCESWKLPLRIFHKNIKEISRKTGFSLEETGRNVRYECFEKVKQEEGIPEAKIAVAHHANDLAETVIFRMLRGTGPVGLAGIRPVCEDIIRPLLCMKKEEILAGLAWIGQDHVEDGTNQCQDYSRNYIRNRILPDMERLNIRAVDHLCRLAGQAGEMADYAASSMDRFYRSHVKQQDGQCILREEDLTGRSQYEKKELAKRMLFDVSGRRRDISAVHIENLADLMEKPMGKKLNLPYGVEAWRTSEGITLSTGKARPKKREEIRKEIFLPPFEEGKRWSVSVPGGNLHFSYELYDGREIEKKDCVKYFDYGKIKYNIVFRTRCKGDYFIMNEKGQRKMLNRYYIDEKIPAGDRDQIFLLADGSHVLWVMGGRISSGYKICPQTQYILKVAAVMAAEEE